MNVEASFKVKFWGVRGSHPVAGPDALHYGGSTPCVEISAGRHTLILDAGTGIIPLGHELMERARRNGANFHLALLLTHFHYDHLQGLPFFSPAFWLGTQLHVFGPAPSPGGYRSLDLGQLLGRLITPPFFPLGLPQMSAQFDFHSVSSGWELVFDSSHQAPALLPPGTATGQAGDIVRVRVLNSAAHPGGVLVYRIEWQGCAVVYATDVEGYANTDRRLVEFARGADLLIHDAQYRQSHYLGQEPGLPSVQGWGHSTAAMACDVARAAGVAKLALFHHEPQYDDRAVAVIEEEARRKFPGSFAAREGQVIDLARDKDQRAAADAVAVQG